MAASTVIAKVKCDAMTQRKYWNGTPEFVYDYEFSVVTSGSEENKEFFASTPSGEIKLRAVRNDLYVPGKQYYVRFDVAD